MRSFSLKELLEEQMAVRRIRSLRCSLRKNALFKEIDEAKLAAANAEGEPEAE